MTAPTEINLEEYFDDSNEALFVRRGELRMIMAYLVDKGTFAQALEAFHKQIGADVQKIVIETLGAAKADDEGRIILLP